MLTLNTYLHDVNSLAPILIGVRTLKKSQRIIKWLTDMISVSDFTKGSKFHVEKQKR